MHSLAEALLGSGPHESGSVASRQDLEVGRTDSSVTHPSRSARPVSPTCSCCPLTQMNLRRQVLEDLGPALNSLWHKGRRLSLSLSFTIFKMGTNICEVHQM